MIPFCQPDLTYCKSSVSAALESGYVGAAGPACREVERQIAEMIGGHCALTSSGTAALTATAWALGLTHGDEIVVPAYGVISTANAFASAGLAIKPIDIGKTGCIEPDNVSRAIGPRTRAICFIDFNAVLGPWLTDIREICDQRGLFLIEDAACAFGRSLGTKDAGTFGHVGIFSFSSPKIVTSGQGGAAVSDRPDIVERARWFISQGSRKSETLATRIGTNLRMSDLQAALLLPQLDRLRALLDHRRDINTIIWGAGNLGHADPAHYNIASTDAPGALVSFLAARGIEARVQYATINRHPAYNQFRNLKFPNADYRSDHSVFLPFGTALTLDQAREIRAALDEWAALPQHLATLDLSEATA